MKGSEKTIEKALVQRVRELGGICLKLESNYRVGLPDRLCLLPGGRVAFIEIKSEGVRPRKRQLYYMGVLSSLGFLATWIDSKKDIDKTLDKALGV